MGPVGWLWKLPDKKEVSSAVHGDGERLCRIPATALHSVLSIASQFQDHQAQCSFGAGELVMRR